MTHAWLLCGHRRPDSVTTEHRTQAPLPLVGDDPPEIGLQRLPGSTPVQHVCELPTQVLNHYSGTESVGADSVSG